MPTDKPKIKIVTLGCAKNEVDSEDIAGVLDNEGFDIQAKARKTDVIVINTCGFLESAKNESVRAIKDAVREKRAGRAKRVIVAGCLSQRLGVELSRLAPGADMYVGVGHMADFGGLARRVLEGGDPVIDASPPHHRWADVETRARSGKPWSAYLKVSEGCDHQCTFCTIPSFRGGHVSKPIERILAEARRLAAMGTREINLIAQDVTQYGFDLYKTFTLPRLLKELAEVEGIDWIRILYFYPNRLTDEVIETMASTPKVLNYIDIPLQHAHPDVLRRMKRPWDGERYLSLFQKLRKAMPDVAIRTTFILGFPGESESEFDYLMKFVTEARLDRVGAFHYSREPGTPSHDMEGQVSLKVKNERYDKLMRAQKQISLEINQEKLGSQIPVLVEELRDGWLCGRSYRDAPEIDGLVYAPGSAELGSIANVKITGAEPYDLYGELNGQLFSTARPLHPLRMAKPVAPL